jgi:hypothetical protein
MAFRAVRAIREYAAATKPLANQLPIDFACNEVSWSSNLRNRTLVREITARIRRGVVELQEGEREPGVVEM